MFARWHDLDDILGAMDLFRSRMNNVFNEFDRSHSVGQGWGRTDNFPRTNLCDTGDNFEVVAEVPEEGYKARRMEREQTSFSRSFTLPYDVEANLVQATLKDGILKMVLPKSEAAKPKQITIN